MKEISILGNGLRSSVGRVSHLIRGVEVSISSQEAKVAFSQQVRLGLKKSRYMDTRYFLHQYLATYIHTYIHTRFLQKRSICHIVQGNRLRLKEKQTMQILKALAKFLVWTEKFGAAWLPCVRRFCTQTINRG